MPDYPLAEKMPEQLKTPSGLAFQDISLEAVLEGKVNMEDLRVTPEALELQAQVAEAAGRSQLAQNLRRAAELVALTEDQILEIYKALRPGRASRQALIALADDLEEHHQARRCAELIREAAGS